DEHAWVFVSRDRTDSPLDWERNCVSQDKLRFYAFGPFLVDTARHLVLRQDELVPLTPKSYDTLLVLVRHGGSLLTKDELMNALWPDHSVEEANLTQQISTIR